MQTLTNLIQAVSGFAWPVIVVVVVWRLFPAIQKIISSRGFTVKVGQVELTVQEVSEQFIKATADLQGKLAEVSATARDVAGPAVVGIVDHEVIIRRILWVDDRPTRNAYDSAQLQALNVEVVPARSTNEALRVLDRNDGFDLIISTMGRSEEGGYDPDAGIKLIKQVRAVATTIPIFIYSSGQGQTQSGRFLDAGANSVISSSSDLFQSIRKVGKFP